MNPILFRNIANYIYQISVERIAMYLHLNTDDSRRRGPYRI